MDNLTENDLQIGIMAHIKIKRRRWDVEITITPLGPGLLPTTFVASADSFYTDHDGIWFDTQKEYDEQGA